MTGYNVGDLVQYNISEAYWNGKVGVITQIRNKAKLAYIHWADNLANSVWVRLDDLILLNRSNQRASSSRT